MRVEHQATPILARTTPRPFHAPPPPSVPQGVAASILAYCDSPEEVQWLAACALVPTVALCLAPNHYTSQVGCFPSPRHTTSMIHGTHTALTGRRALPQALTGPGRHYPISVSAANHTRMPCDHHHTPPSPHTQEGRSNVVQIKMI